MGQNRRVKIRFFMGDVFWVGVTCLIIGFCFGFYFGMGAAS